MKQSHLVENLIYIQSLKITLIVITIFVLLYNTALLILSIFKWRKYRTQSLHTGTFAIANLLNISFLINLTYRGMVEGVYDKIYHSVVEVVSAVGYQMHILCLAYVAVNYDKLNRKWKQTLVHILLLLLCSVILAIVPLYPEIENYIHSHGLTNDINKEDYKYENVTDNNDTTIIVITPKLNTSTLQNTLSSNHGNGTDTVTDENDVIINTETQQQNISSLIESGIPSNKLLFSWVLADHSYGWQYALALETFNLILHCLIILIILCKLCINCKHEEENPEEENCVYFKMRGLAVFTMAVFSTLHWVPVSFLVLLGFGVKIFDNNIITIWVHLLSRGLSAATSPVIFCIFKLWRNTKATRETTNNDSDDSSNSKVQSNDDNSTAGVQLSTCFENGDDITAFDAVMITSTLWADIQKLHTFGMVSTAIDADHIYIDKNKESGDLKTRIIGVPTIPQQDELNAQIQANKDAIGDIFDQIMRYVREKEAKQEEAISRSKSWRMLTRKLPKLGARPKTFIARGLSRNKKDSHKSGHRINFSKRKKHLEKSKSVGFDGRSRPKTFGKTTKQVCERLSSRHQRYSKRLNEDENAKYSVEEMSFSIKEMASVLPTALSVESDEQPILHI